MNIVKPLYCTIAILCLSLASVNADDFKQYVHLRDGQKCGLKGHEVFVVNDIKDRQIRVTIRVTTKMTTRKDDFNGVEDKVYKIPAGGETNIGCTHSDFIPVAFHTYEIVGCEIQ